MLPSLSYSTIDSTFLASEKYESSLGSRVLNSTNTNGRKRKIIDLPIENRVPSRKSNQQRSSRQNFFSSIEFPTDAEEYIFCPRDINIPIVETVKATNKKRVPSPKKIIKVRHTMRKDAYLLSNQIHHEGDKHVLFRDSQRNSHGVEHNTINNLSSQTKEKKRVVSSDTFSRGELLDNKAKQLQRRLNRQLTPLVEWESKKKNPGSDVEADFWATYASLKVQETQRSKISPPLNPNQTQIEPISIVPSKVLDQRSMSRMAMIDRFQSPAYYNKFVFDDHNQQYHISNSIYIPSKRLRAFGHNPSILWQSDSLKKIQAYSNPTTLQLGKSLRDNIVEVRKRSRSRIILKERRLWKAKQAFRRALDRLILVNRWITSKGQPVLKKENQKLKVVWEDIHYLPEIKCL